MVAAIANSEWLNLNLLYLEILIYQFELICQVVQATGAINLTILAAFFQHFFQRFFSTSFSAGGIEAHTEAYGESHTRVPYKGCQSPQGGAGTIGLKRR